MAAKSTGGKQRAGSARLLPVRRLGSEPAGGLAVGCGLSKFAEAAKVLLPSNDEQKLVVAELELTVGKHFKFPSEHIFHADDPDAQLPAQVDLLERLAGERLWHRHLDKAVLGVDRQEIDNIGPRVPVRGLASDFDFRVHDPLDAEPAKYFSMLVRDAFHDDAVGAEFLAVQRRQ